MKVISAIILMVFFVVMLRAKHSRVLKLRGKPKHFSLLEPTSTEMQNEAKRTSIAKRWLDEFRILIEGQFSFGKALDILFFFQLIQPSNPELDARCYQYYDKKGMRGLIRLERATDNYNRYDITHLSMTHLTDLCTDDTLVTHLQTFLLTAINEYEGEVTFTWERLLELGGESDDILKRAAELSGFKRSLVGYSWLSCGNTRSEPTH